MLIMCFIHKTMVLGTVSSHPLAGAAICSSPSTVDRSPVQELAGRDGLEDIACL